MSRSSLARLLLFSLAVTACAGSSGADDHRGGNGTGAGGSTVSAGTDGGGSGGSSASGTDGASACGTCPAGYTCGSANGIAVCRAPSGVPLFSNVFVLMMENTSWATLEQSTNTPYIHDTLMKTAAYATDYHGITHPSLPNYLAIVSGAPGTQSDSLPVACDCDPTGSPPCPGSCNQLSLFVSICSCPQTGTHIGDQISASGLSWKAYAEDMGTPCNPTTAGFYAPKHNPFVYFMHETALADCEAHVVDFAELAPDLAGETPSFSFIVPNVVHDMHGVFGRTADDFKNGDAWLADHVPAITNSAAYRKAGVLFIVWEEADDSIGDDPIAMFVLSPLARSGGAVIATRYDHYSLLATLEDGLALPRLGNAAQVTPLVDFFPPE